MIHLKRFGMGLLIWLLVAAVVAFSFAFSYLLKFYPLTSLGILGIGVVYVTGKLILNARS